MFISDLYYCIPQIYSLAIKYHGTVLCHTWNIPCWCPLNAIKVNQRKTLKNAYMRKSVNAIKVNQRKTFENAYMRKCVQVNQRKTLVNPQGRQPRI
jgi:hypothetical protein